MDEAVLDYMENIAADDSCDDAAEVHQPLACVIIAASQLVAATRAVSGCQNGPNTCTVSHCTGSGETATGAAPPAPDLRRPGALRSQPAERCLLLDLLSCLCSQHSGVGFYEIKPSCPKSQILEASKGFQITTVSCSPILTAYEELKA